MHRCATCSADPIDWILAHRWAWDVRSALNGPRWWRKHSPERGICNEVRELKKQGFVRSPADWIVQQTAEREIEVAAAEGTACDACAAPAERGRARVADRPRRESRLTGQFRQEILERQHLDVVEPLAARAEKDDDPSTDLARMLSEAIEPLQIPRVDLT